MAEDTFQKLMQVLTASNYGANATVENLLVQLGDTNPNVKLVAQYLEARRRASEAETSSDDINEEVYSSQSTDSDKELQHLAEREHKLRLMAKNMAHEITGLRKINDTLAGALGACNVCWGNALNCEDCGGKGVPGCFMPDKKLFLEFCAPSIRKIINSKEQSSYFAKKKQSDNSGENFNPNNKERK